MSNNLINSSVAALREALIELKDKVCNSNKCPYEYCKPECEYYSIVEKARKALTSDAGKDYHNPAYVEVLKKARETLKRCMTSAFSYERNMAGETLAAIDKTIGGEKDGI